MNQNINHVDLPFSTPTAEEEQASLVKARAHLDAILAVCVSAGYDYSIPMVEFIQQRLQPAGKP